MDGYDCINPFCQRTLNTARSSFLIAKEDMFFGKEKV